MSGNSWLTYLEYLDKKANADFFSSLHQVEQAQSGPIGKRQEKPFQVVIDWIVASFHKKDVTTNISALTHMFAGLYNIFAGVNMLVNAGLTVRGESQ